MKDEVGFIIIGIVVIIILVAGGLYLYHTSRFNEYPVKEKTVKATITNQTSFPQLIVSQGKSYLSNPGDTNTLGIDLHEDVSAVSTRPNGEKVEFIHRLSNEKVNHLYITPDGFRTNLTSSRNVDLVNMADYPVVFIQKSLKGGELHAIGTVPPMSSSQGHFVGSRSEWQVAHPGSENIPITHVKIGTQEVSRLVFDGLKLRAY